jgi:hypothetical protein
MYQVSEQPVMACWLRICALAMILATSAPAGPPKSLSNSLPAPRTESLTPKQAAEKLKEYWYLGLAFGVVAIYVLGRTNRK